MDTWVRRMVGLKDALRSGHIDVTRWQVQAEALNRSIPLKDLTAYLNLDALTHSFTYGSGLAEVRDPLLPRELIGSAGMRQWFVRVFGLRRGGAIIPHVHNNMVSAHLVLHGSFHARTHDRLVDLADAVVLRPTRDGLLNAGDILSMSDRRDNQHWLIAREDRSMTLDVGIVGLPASWAYVLRANATNMIYVDPTAAPDRDGTVVAPVISFEQGVAKFAA